MKISFINKLHLGSIFLILTGSLIGVLFFNTIQKQSEEADWVKAKNEQVQQILGLQKLLADTELSHRSILSTHNQSAVLAYLNTQEKILNTFAQLKSLPDGSAPQVQQLGLIRQTIWSVLQIWDSQHDSGKAQAVQVSGLEANQVRRSRQLLEQVLRDTQMALAKREEEMSSNIEFLTEGAVGSTALLFTIALILTYFYSQEFKRHRHLAQELRSNVEQLEHLNKASDEYNWVLRGSKALNESLQNLQDLESIAKESIHLLSRHLEVPAIGYYSCQEETQQLQLIASKALSNAAPRAYAIGEGLVGQAATQNEILITKDVPNTYWSIQSGTGQALPGQLVCVPLWFDGELKGVIELAYFHAVPELHLSLLKIAARDIATAWSTVFARVRRIALLKQVQEQKSILESQQEELRQTNEELTLQAESLQASEEELRVHEEELRQTNAELNERNKAVEIARQTLMTQSRELEEASKYKSEFLANMSHELRTPLNSVLILASLLAENKPKNLTDKQIEYANVIHKSGADLLELINDILDLSKIEAGKVEMLVEPVKVVNIVEDMRQTFTVVADQKGVTFNTDVAETVPPTIQTDKQRLEQTIRNLLSNAFKFTPAKGSVTLAFRTEKPSGNLTNPLLKQADQVLAISVTDTGIGIPEDRQQLIFDAFQQADGSTSRKYGGTGLGLSITRELIQRLRGEVQLRSEPGKGSTFTLVLPLTDVDEPASVVPATESAKPTEQANNQTHDDRDSIQKDDQVMLIIEDDPIFARIVRDFARSRQYKTILASRGDEGLEFVRKYNPSAIILDMQLPVVNGWSILNELKSDETLKHIPVHIISGMEDLRLPADGVMTYLQKPVSTKDLDQVFMLIGNQVGGQVKKVLVQSGEHLKDDDLKKVINQRHLDLACDYVLTNEEVLQKAAEQAYDCLIVDMGHDLTKGINKLRQLRAKLDSNSMPVIIYIDDDLSPANELKLKKLSDVVIRESSHSLERLMDELEIFLYKVQEDKKKPLPQPKVELASQQLEGRKVLLVDDDMRNIFALSTLLEQHQMNVITAYNGLEALEMLQEHTDTDIVLMDIMMPEMDGYEATQQIRNELHLSKLPIIALTAKAMPGDREKVIQAGASDYIAKPVDKSQLFSLMRVWLSN
ncbi:hypothetical protein GCM10028805_00050 [Spirosoma harenae]